MNPVLTDLSHSIGRLKLCLGSLSPVDDCYLTLGKEIKRLENVLECLQSRAANASASADIAEITTLVAANFSSFGGGKTSSWNPLAAALADRPPQFAAGVDIEDVVRFVLASVASASMEN